MKLLGVILTILLLSLECYSDRWVSAYYTGWNYDQYRPWAVDYNSLTHLMIFSVRPNFVGGLDKKLFQLTEAAGTSLAKDLVAKAHAKNKKVILTIGGHSTADAFVASTTRYRGTLVANIINLAEQWGVDGIDLDWEDLDPVAHGALFRNLVEDIRAERPK